VNSWELWANVTYDAHSDVPPDGALEAEYVTAALALLRERMGDAFSDFAFSIFNCTNPAIRPASFDDPHPRKVLIYTADEKGTLPLELANQYVAIFKGYVPEQQNSRNIYPLPLGFVNGVTQETPLPTGERSIDVFFSGHLNRNRINLYREFSMLRYAPKWIVETAVAQPRVRNLTRIVFGTDFSSAFDNAYICFTDSFAAGLSRKAYAEKLGSAKIALCPGGFHSPETFRHYEAARAGCVVISEKLPDNPLYRGSPILQVASWREGIALARELLRDDARLAELQRQTLAWWDDRWSPEAVARDMQEKLERLTPAVAVPS
jgi:hypothetical protein